MFQGVFSVLPTPFGNDGELDLESLRCVIDLYIRAGVNGVTALGVTGEVARLTDRERALVRDTVLEHVSGRVPVIVGTTSEGLKTCISLSRSAESAGAAGVMVSPPRMTKISSAAVVNHFAALAEAIDIGIVVQDYPPASGYSMEASLLVRIARDVPRARTIKLEDPPTPLKIAQILELIADTSVSILGGLGGVFLLEELIAGAQGTMTGFAYPEFLVEIVGLFRSGETGRATDLFFRSVPLMRFEFQETVGMAIRKEILMRRGVLKHAGVRLPGVMPDTATYNALDRLLKWMRQQGGTEWI